MRLKKKLKSIILATCLTLLIIQVVKSAYDNHLVIADGNIRLAGGINLKPNSIHTYTPEYYGRVNNISLGSGTLTLSKSDYAYNIACSTEDNISISLFSWFYNYVTSLRGLAEDETTLNFTVNSRNFGEPQSISGVSSWSYEESTTTITFSCANYSNVIIRFSDIGTEQIVWYLDRMEMWLGIAGLTMCTFAPIMCVYFIKKDDLPSAAIWGLMLFVIGMGLVIGWLWG